MVNYVTRNNTQCPIKISNHNLGEWRRRRKTTHNHAQKANKGKHKQFFWSLLQLNGLELDSTVRSFWPVRPFHAHKHTVVFQWNCLFGLNRLLISINFNLTPFYSMPFHCARSLCSLPHTISDFRAISFF